MHLSCRPAPLVDSRHLRPGITSTHRARSPCDCIKVHSTRSPRTRRGPLLHIMQDGSAKCAVARQWGVDCMRTQWSALARNSTLAAPVHALTVAGMTIVAALLTLRAARLFIRSAHAGHPLASPFPPPPCFILATGLLVILRNCGRFDMQTGLAVSSIVLVCWGFGAVRTLVVLAILASLILAFLLNGVPTENAGHRVGVVGYDRSATQSAISAPSTLSALYPLLRQNLYPDPDVELLLLSEIRPTFQTCLCISMSASYVAGVVLFRLMIAREIQPRSPTVPHLQQSVCLPQPAAGEHAGGASGSGEARQPAGPAGPRVHRV